MNFFLRPRNVNFLLGITCVFFAFSGSQCFAQAAQTDNQLDISSFSSSPSDLPNFHEVIKSQIYRGGQPTTIGIAQLAKAGIKTVVNLRAEAAGRSAQEKQTVENLGMRYYYMPMSPIAKPSDADVAKIENVLLGDLNLRPIFVHCHFGEDRTGLIIGLHRVFKEIPAFSPVQAYQEMINLGFHPALGELANYFYSKTGWYPLQLQSFQN